MTKKTDKLERATYTPIQAGKVSGLGHTRIYELLKANEIAHIKSGNRFLIPKEYFHRWINSAGGTAPCL